MEKVFIQVIYRLTEQILRRDFDPVTTEQELLKHLAKARQIKSRLYEAETLNTLGILYSLASDHGREIEHYELGLAIARELNDLDLQLKFSSNLSETFVALWMLDESRTMLENGIRLCEERQLKSIVSLYLYSNAVKLAVLLGDLETARARFKTAWEISQDTHMGQYSRTEYAQVLAQLHLHKALIDIATRECDDVLNRIELASGLVISSAEIATVGLYHAILCLDHEQTGRDWEQRLIEAEGGSLSAVTALMCADFLARQGEGVWSRHFLKLFGTQEVIASDAMRKAAALLRQQLANLPES